MGPGVSKMGPNPGSTAPQPCDFGQLPAPQLCDLGQDLLCQLCHGVLEN